MIISSTAQRARQTAELVGEACGYEGDILFTRDLYLAEPEGYIEAIQLHTRDENLVMVVGHNPGIEDLASGLTDESLSMTTANLVQVELPIQAWGVFREHTQGKLIHLWRPKDL